MAQPFSDPIYDGTPLDYDGDEVFAPVTDLAGSLTPVDWVLVEFRRSPDGAPVFRRPAILAAWGTLLDVFGNVRIDFAEVGLPTSQGPYYVVVRHRNHAAAMARSTTTGGGPWVNLRAGVYGDGAATLPDGHRALYAADPTLDGRVTALDFNAYSAGSSALATGYHPADFNLDGQVTALDFNLYSTNSTSLAASSVPDREQTR
jgi:hypothetical protein